MRLLIKIIRRLYSKIIGLISGIADAIYPPGFAGASLYEISIIFFGYVGKPRFNLYAGALSFNFFIALFPSILFLFTLVAYIPIEDLQIKIMDLMENFLPDATFQTINTTVSDIVGKQRSGLLSLGFFTALYFASNGFHTMSIAFDSSLEDDIKRKRTYLQIRIISIGMTFIVSILLILSIIVLIVSGYISLKITEWGANQRFMNFSLSLFEYITLGALVYFIISFVYYYGPSSIKKWKFFSPGSILATVLALVSTYFFTYYVNNFNTYNKLYGSIGAIIALMLLIYVNIYSILIGFELNHSINKVSIEKIREEKKNNTFIS
jgi:membrane protein